MEAQLPGKLIGLSFHTIDPDGRFILPQRTRKLLQHGFVLTRGIENCLWLLPYHVFEKMSSDWAQGSTLWDHDRRMLGWRFIGQAVPVEPDRSYRVVIPKELRDAVQLGSDVVALGIGDRVELWNAEAWQQFDQGIPAEDLQSAAGRVFLKPAAVAPEPSAAA